jgi:thioredoxin 1
LVLTDNDFSDKLPDKPTIVDFWASWCGPCQALGPVLEELSVELSDKWLFAKINVDENSETASKFRIRSIPCLILFKDKAEVGRLVGYKDKKELVLELESYL